MTNGAFTAGNDNGKAATLVLGQQSFNATASGSSLAAMNNPHGVSCDSSGFVYVADTGNNRILIFSDPHSSGAQSGEAAATFIGGLSAPQSVFVNVSSVVAPAGTGEIWVANTGAGASLRYANYNSILLGNASSISSIQEVSSYNGNNIGLHPVAVAQDQYGALYVADDANRVAFYYPGLSACNGATFMAAFSSKAPNLCDPLFDSSNSVTLNAHPLAPGVFATLFPCANCAGDQFSDQIASWNGTTYPVPAILNDTQVFVDGVAAPLYYVGSPIAGDPYHPAGQINFVVPNTARTVGNADVEVVRVSTGQVLGATSVPMAATSPGILMCQGVPWGTYRASCVLNVNQDGTVTVNGPSNPAPRGSIISIYATGQGFVPGAPSDGSLPGAIAASSTALTVLINGLDVNTYAGELTQHILYSGLNQFPGVWQINVLIPQGVAPASQEPQWNNANLLNIIADGTINIDVGLGWKTVIWVK
jgi:uncharacterized protein (TIGR03437 family)